MSKSRATRTLWFMSSRQTKVTIVGGGVAALEALIALRGLAEERVDIELVTPSPSWAYRPMAVAEPFGLGEVRNFDLVKIARDHGAKIHLAGVQSIDPAAHTISSWDGRAFDYDILLVAVGARPAVAVPGSVTLQGPGYTGRFRTVLRQLDERQIRRVAFAVPAGATWPLPLYELALMTGAHVAERGLRKVELSFATPEEQPLQLFGAPTAEAVGALLDERGISFEGGRYASELRDGELLMVPGPNIEADRVVSLPRLHGPALPGLPHDAEGFIPTDLHGLVDGELDVYAAGDATSSAIKQGGVATQQADAVAEAIAARVGAPIEPRPFKPILRALLLTGSTPRYLRAEVGGAPDHPAVAATHALWWPPSKIAGRWLAPYLAGAYPASRSAAGGSSMPDGSPAAAASP
jgi:sulfide:quinone oxidoreductase